MTAVKNRPVVLVIAGNDPSGGAGIQAYIQAITAAGAHPAPVISALTVQDTRDAYELRPVDPELVRAQASRVLEDLQLRAIKLGVLANSGIAAAVATLLAQAGTVPVVLDPVLAAAGGGRLAEEDLLQSLLDKLVPTATIITPNAIEIRALAPKASDHASRARVLTDLGADYVLAKGGDEDTPDVVNILFDGSGEIDRYVYPRLPHSYHGSGCTLASAIAARLALGLSVPEAVASAQDYTFETLRRSYRPGRGQHVPDRWLTELDP